MKTITLQQPYAALVAAGLKTIETRSWNTKYRGWLAIHAGKDMADAWLLSGEALKAFKLVQHPNPPSQYLKYGFIVAAAELVDVIPMTDDWIATQVPENELCLGFYSVGRFAWILRNTVPLEVPIPAKGRLGLWESPHCHANNDGDCDWVDCPQKKHRHSYCPIAKLNELDPSWFGE